MPRYAKRVRMIDRISEIKGIKRLLFIYSETDDYTPVSMGKRFIDKSNVPAELWTVQHGEHAKIIKSQHQDAYKEKLKVFIEECLDQNFPTVSKRSGS